MNTSPCLLIDACPEQTGQWCAAHPSKRTLLCGDNTQHMLQLLFKDRIGDYHYCDFNNEISVAELARYCNEHHQLEGVYMFADAYKNSTLNFKRMFDTLHPSRWLIHRVGRHYHYRALGTRYTRNHLSCIPPAYQHTTLGMPQALADSFD